MSPLPGPPWCAPECASPWACEHVCGCVRWASSLSRPAWQPGFTRFSRVDVWGGKKCAVSAGPGCVCVCARAAPICHALPLFPPVWRRFPFRSPQPLPPSATHGLNECVRGRGSALCLSSLRSSLLSSSAGSPSLASQRSLTSVGGLTRSLD